MFFRRHKTEEPPEVESPAATETSHTEHAYPEIGQLPDTLKLIDKEGREDGGWLFDIGPIEPTGKDTISVFRHNEDGQIEYRHASYADLVKWNIADSEDNNEEQNMAETTQPEPEETHRPMSEAEIRAMSAKMTQTFDATDRPVPPPEVAAPIEESMVEEPIPPAFAWPLPEGSTPVPSTAPETIPVPTPEVTPPSEGLEPDAEGRVQLSPETIETILGPAPEIYSSETTPAVAESTPVPPPEAIRPPESADADGTEPEIAPHFGDTSGVLYWDDGNFDIDRTGETEEINGITYNIRRLVDNPDDTNASRYYLVPEGMSEQDIPDEFIHSGGTSEAIPESTGSGVVSPIDSATETPPESAAPVRDEAEATPVPEVAVAETEPVLHRPDEDILRSAREAIEALPNSAGKKEVKERIRELETSDFKKTHKGSDLGDTPEQSQARVDLKVEKLVDSLEGLKAPLPKTKERDGRTVEDNITLQSQLLLNISEKNKYNEINRENLERTIRLVTTLIGHDQEAVKEAAMKGNIEAASDTLTQLKEYITKAQEDTVYMATPGAKETLASYQRTVDRLEGILKGPIRNHGIDRVVAELRATLVRGEDARAGHPTPENVGGDEPTEIIPPGEGGEPPAGGGGEVLPPIEDGGGEVPPGGGGETTPEARSLEELRADLDEARREYLEAFNTRHKWFRKRVSEELYETLKKCYEKAAQLFARQQAVESVENDHPEATGEEKQQMIEAKLIIEVQNERKALSDLEIKKANGKAEEYSGAQKIRKWMKDHPKTVVFAGIAMGGIPGGILLAVGSYDLANKYLGSSSPKKETFFSVEVMNNPDVINAKVAQLVEGASRDNKEIDNDNDRKELYDKILKYEREELKKVRTFHPDWTNEQIEVEIIKRSMEYLEVREEIRDNDRRRKIITATLATTFGPWLGGAFGVFGYI